jgi:hypothetical protein
MVEEVEPKRGNTRTGEGGPPGTRQTTAQAKHLGETFALKSVMTHLLNIVEDLAKEKDSHHANRAALHAKDAIKTMGAVLENRDHEPPPTLNRPAQTTWETRLQRIEEAIMKISNQKPVPPPSYAAVAKGARPPIPTRRVPETRPRIRVEIPDLTEEEQNDGRALLTRVQKDIKEAMAVTKLKSGKFDIRVHNQTLKDRILNNIRDDTASIKILRQDYPVEVANVPLTLDVQHGMQGANRELLRTITEGTAKNNPGVVFTSVRWLHGGKERQWAEQDKAKGRAEKTKGTLILYCPTLDMLQQVVRHGVIIGVELLQARIHDPGCVSRQCYKCQNWGHTQHSCTKDARCGHCAGTHETNTCKNKSQSSCVNCGVDKKSENKHKSWQKKECKLYQAYLTGCTNRRLAARSESDILRTHGWASEIGDADGWSQVVGGRKRATVQDTGTKKRGRPSGVEKAGKERTQSSLASWTTTTGAFMSPLAGSQFSPFGPQANASPNQQSATTQVNMAGAQDTMGCNGTPDEDEQYTPQTNE